MLAVTDLSPEGDAAISEAIQQARTLDAELCVVHSVPHIDAVRPLFPQQHAEDFLTDAELPRRAEAALRSRLADLDTGTQQVEVAIERGTTVEGALHAAQRWRPTLVVITVAAGAVDAVRLVRHITVPTLVVRPSPATRIVLAGTDLSDPSMPAIRAANDMCARIGGELIVAHAIEASPLAFYGGEILPMLHSTPKELHDAAEERVSQALHERGVTAKVEITVGPSSSALIKLAEARKAQLLVVATHGRTGLTRFVLGSVAETVIRQAPCSVLVVRAA